VLGLGAGDFVKDGDPVALSPQGWRTPKFSAHIYIQTAAWMKLVLGMVVGLSSREFVLDADPAPSPKRGYPLSNSIQVGNFEIGPEIAGTFGYS